MFHSTSRRCFSSNAMRQRRPEYDLPNASTGATVLCMGTTEASYIRKLSEQAGPGGHVIVAAQREKDLEILAEDLWKATVSDGARIHLHRLAAGNHFQQLVADYGRFDLILLHNDWCTTGNCDALLPSCHDALHPGGQTEITLTGLFLCRHRIKKLSNAASRAGLQISHQCSDRRQYRTVLQKPYEATGKMVA